MERMSHQGFSDIQLMRVTILPASTGGRPCVEEVAIEELFQTIYLAVLSLAACCV